MTATAPRTRTEPPGRPSGPGEPAHRGFAAIVPIRRMFAVEHRDALLLIGTAVFLTGLGLIMVLSASSVTGQAADGDPFARALRQGLFAAVGIPLMLVVGRLPMPFWKRWAWPALLTASVLQLLVFVPGLSTGNGFNTNWVTIGGITFQPSELLKFTLIIWMASVFAARGEEIRDAKRLLLPVLPVVAVAVGLVLAGKDLGTASIIFMIVFACAFFAGARIWHLLLGVVGVAGLAIAFAVTNPSRVDRITDFLHGCTEDAYQGTCWQVFQAYFGLANGGVLGTGLGNSRAKWSWLPEADSDYIFAIIGEELGLIGAIVVIALFVLLAIVLLRIMRKASDPFARIVTGGILVWIVGQAFVNIAVVLGLLPVLGVPLPLISAGGSSLLAVLLALGVVLSFTRAARPRRS